MNTVCTIKDCKKPTKRGRRICDMHRSRFIRHGDYGISPNWNNLKKGQPLVTPLGYLRINIGGKRVLHHRYIVEQHLGRKLLASERVHHKNHIKTDNRIENLELMKSQSEHILHHHLKKPLIDWSKYKIPKNNGRKVCLINGCSSKTRTRGLCAKHFQSFYYNYLY